jgi:Uncharacterized protein conserved in bacteria
MRVFYNIMGSVALLLAIAGILLPILPTTPFLLLASACYMRGSTRMHNWMMNQRHLGPYLQNFQAGRGIPLRAKIIAIAMMWCSLSFSAWLVPLPWLRVLLLITGIGVTYYLYRMPTLPPRSIATLESDQP